MYDIETPSGASDARPLGAVMMLFSLSLILLAFFILLNAISSPVKAKSAAALYGVQANFDYQGGSGRGDTSFGADMPEGPLWIPRVGATVRGTVVNLLPQLTPQVVEVGTEEIRVTLPEGDAWDGEVLSEAAQALLSNLAALQSTDADDVGMRVKLLGGNAGVREARMDAMHKAVPGLMVAWDVDGEGALQIILSAESVGVPEFARRAEKLIHEQGAVIEAVGSGEGGHGAP